MAEHASPVESVEHRWPWRMWVSVLVQRDVPHSVRQRLLLPAAYGPTPLCEGVEIRGVSRACGYVPSDVEFFEWNRTACKLVAHSQRGRIAPALLMADRRVLLNSVRLEVDAGWSGRHLFDGPLALLPRNELCRVPTASVINVLVDFDAMELNYPWMIHLVLSGALTGQPSSTEGTG